MGNPIAAGALLTQGLRADFVNVYDQHYKGIMDAFGDIFWLDATSDKLTEFYAYLESAPYPVRWDRGSMMPSKNILSRQFSVVNRDWARRIFWHTNDRADDQTGSLFKQARGLGQNWATLAERIIIGQILPGATDPDLLPAVPNAADGSALYIASTRFGRAGGNTVTLTSASTVQGIITDLMSVVQAFYDFQDTESQPLWDASEIRKGITVIYPTSMTLVMRQAATALIVPLAASTATSNAGISNLVLSQDIPFKFVATQRLTATAYYCFLNGLSNEKKPIFRQIREPFFETFATWENSDHSRDTGEEYIQFKSREGYGVPVPFGTVKVV